MRKPWSQPPNRAENELKLILRKLARNSFRNTFLDADSTLIVTFILYQYNERYASTNIRLRAPMHAFAISL